MVAGWRRVDETEEAFRAGQRGAAAFVRAAVLRADLAREEEVSALVPQAAAALGRPVGVLVNNASAFERDEWDDATRESWDRHLEPNLRAPFVLTQAFARALPEGAEGAVVRPAETSPTSSTKETSIASGGGGMTATLPSP